MKYEILDSAALPESLKKYNVIELEKLCEEIRQFLINGISKTGGHLSSNLGVVELTVALHKVFDLKSDQIIFDVGHQAYVHKILTGRKDKFDTLRKFGGLSGFPKILESEYDAFGTGHSSTSISAALGLAQAKLLQGSKDLTIAVIGDGAMTGGLSFEGLNNAGQSKARLIVILNDNEHSISKNDAAFASYLARLTSRTRYIKFRDNIKRMTQRIPKFYNLIKNAKNVIKDIIFHKNYFDELGFDYIGPVNGHSIKDLITIFQRACQYDRPVLIHVKTIKGKGYIPAETLPISFHGTPPFYVETGELREDAKTTFTDIFSEKLCTLAAVDNKICAITAAMKDGTGLCAFEEKYGDRFFDCGIAEEHAVVFAAGLARNGMKPVVAIYSTFLQRAYDQIIHDVALQSLPCIFAIDRAGISGSDGETHQGIFDVNFLLHIPGIEIYSPCTYAGLNDCLAKAVKLNKPVAVRYPKGYENLVLAAAVNPNCNEITVIGDKNPEISIITYGRISAEAYIAYKKLSDENIKCRLIILCRITNIKINDLIKDSKLICFVEETVRTGSVAEKLLSGINIPNKIFAIDSFVTHGKAEELIKSLGLDGENIYSEIKRELQIE